VTKCTSSLERGVAPLVSAMCTLFTFSLLQYTVEAIAIGQKLKLYCIITVLFINGYYCVLFMCPTGRVEDSWPARRGGRSVKKKKE
jgi:hypothetical protein